MSTAVPPTPPTPATPPTPPGSGTSPSSAPAGGAPAGSPTPITASEPYRYGTDAPAWAQGKTASEVLGIVEQQNSVIRNYISNGAPAPAAPPAAAPAQPSIADDAYVTGADLNRIAPRMMDGFRSDLGQVVDMAAQNALETVKREYPREFQKYGMTINANLAQLGDKRSWTVDNLRKLVKYSLADHVEDIAGEIAQRRLAEMEPTLRSNGAAPVSVTPQEQRLTLQSDALPADWKQRAEKAGLTEAAVDEFCRANEMTREQFFGLFGKTAITEAPRR